MADTLEEAVQKLRELRDSLLQEVNPPPRPKLTLVKGGRDT
jgi:hypothetical protein